MGIRNCLTVILLLLATLSWSKTGVLDRVISINIKATPIKTILFMIETRTGVQFSYNPSIIDDNHLVSLNIREKTVEFGLNLMFDNTVRFKEAGNYIVLLKNENIAEIRKRKKSKTYTVFRGVIRDKASGKPISGVSIYDIDARYAAVSKSDGSYELKIPRAETVRSLYIRKVGFHEVVFVIDATSDSVNIRNVALESSGVDVEKIVTKKPEGVYLPIENKALSGELVSYETYVHGENLAAIHDIRIAQISLVPSLSIGSNLSTNGLIYNHFSLNVLGGYSKGVEGVEIGGLFNVNREDVKWVQVGGLGNLVGRDVLGLQAGGIYNIVRGKSVGVQVAGVANINGDNYEGAQIAGISNLAGKNFVGLQLGGIATFAKGNFKGVQLSGVFSAVRSGFYGLQAAGISCTALGDSYGLQASGIFNTVSSSLNGGQIAGIANVAGGGTNFLQTAGIMNFANQNRGLQIAGILNFANKNKGLQLGLINLSNESTGLSIGLINFVKTGYHKAELATNEIFPINLSLKSGPRYFYNTYHFGIKFGETPIMAAGLGFGTNFTLKNAWKMSVDLSSHLLIEEGEPILKSAHLYKFAPTIEYSIKKWLTVFAGPSFNVNYQRTQNGEGIFESDISLNPFYDKVITSGRLQMWLGGQFGFRF